MKRCLACLVSLLPLASVADAHAGGSGKVPLAILTPSHIRMGQSIGSPTEGHLVGGARLEESPALRLLPVYADADARYGLGSLVMMIDRGARAVRHKYPDAVLSVGQLSRRGGGDIDRHASHESGRDADLSFYIKSQTGHPLYSDHMVSFRGDGTAPSWPGALFDEAKNWELVSALVTDPMAKVTYLFVAAPLRARLLAYAARIGAPLAIRNHAAELMVQPRGSLPHDDHFHVRIACPSGMTSCIELPTRSRIAHAPVHHAPVLAHASSPKPAAPAVHSPPTTPEPPLPTFPSEEEHAREPAAVLTTPFDDVDGPAEPHVSANRIDIQ
jgi:penicillin-insensitive murein DD-endopeptidase